jgi:hypothetical protein
MATKTRQTVAVVNQQFARKIFGLVETAIGGYYKMPDGTRIQVVGVAEDGKYGSLTEEPHAAVFLPILQWPSNSNWLVVHPTRDPQQLGEVIRRTLRQLDPGLPADIESRYGEMATVLFPSQMASLALGVMGGIGYEPGWRFQAFKRLQRSTDDRLIIDRWRSTGILYQDADLGEPIRVIYQSSLNG